MPRYTEEQITRANETDLVSFLRVRGEKLKKSGKEYRWMKHDSLTVDHNEWYRFSGSKGGHPIDFLMEFYNMSFPEAVKTLINESPGEDKQEVKKMEQEDAGSHESCPIPLEKAKLQLPKAYENNDRVREYLIKERKISEKIIEQMLAEGKIYEDAVKHNVIFIGCDPKGTVRYAGIRGTKEKYRGDAPGSEKAYGFSHTGTDDTLFVFEAPIDLLSFLSTTGDGWETHHYISLGGVSEKALIQYLADHKKIRKIFLCLDNDTAGNAACEKLAEKIPDDKMVMRLRPAKKDWNECLTAGIDRKDMAEKIPLKKKQVQEENPIPVIKMSDVEEKVVQWLWYPFIPFGKVTLIQGNPGKGKTWLAMALCAYCTAGRELPNALPIEPFNVFYQTAEDGVGDTIKPRLAKCGADMTRVRFINEEEKQLSMTDERIEKAIRQNNVRLMIMDPIQAYLGANVDMNRANEIRPLFRNLSNIAERTGCAIVLIGHLNKASGVQSDYRTLGSVDIAAAVRSILFVEKVEKEKSQDIRVVYQQKDSLAKKENPVAFSLSDEGLIWMGEYDISIDDLLAGNTGTKKETKLEKAKKLILELLGKRKMMCLEELEAELQAYEISARTGRDARKDLEDQLIYGWYQSRKTISLKKDS